MLRSLRFLPALLALVAAVGCAEAPSSIRLPGGPMRGTMTHDEAIGARTGLTRIDRVPPPAETH